MIPLTDADIMEQHNAANVPNFTELIRHMQTERRVLRSSFGRRDGSLDLAEYPHLRRELQCCNAVIKILIYLVRDIKRQQDQYAVMAQIARDIEMQATGAKLQ